jgi:L-asparaginase
VIDALAAAGAKAIVSAGQAAGKGTPEETQALLRARRAGVLIIQSNRTGSGRVVERTKLLEQGIVAADNLNPQKARVLAMVALTRTDDPVQVQRFFREY